MTSMPTHLRTHIMTLIKELATQHSAAAPYKVILGLSGGPDSVFLYHQLAALHKEGLIILTAAHLNHQWRGNDADDDAAFCAALTAADGIACIVKTADQISITKKFNGSKEELGRHLRRAFFAQLHHKHGALCVMLAHHADDQLETFLIRLARGSSLTGLCAMREHAGTYLRPLLGLRKQEIMSWLDENKSLYRTDTSNASADFLRNRLRSQALPALESADSRFTTNALRSIGQLQETEQFLEKLTLQIFQAIFTHSETGTLVGSLSAFNAQAPFMQKRLLVMMLTAAQAPCTHSDAFLEEILRFLTSPRGGSHNLAPGWSLAKNQGTFWLEKR